MGLLDHRRRRAVHARQPRRRRTRGRMFRYWPVGPDRHRAGQALAGARAGPAGSRASSSSPRAPGCCSSRSAIVDVSVWQLWPLLLVLFGASMVWQGLRGRPAAASGRPTRTSTSARWRCSAASTAGTTRARFQGGDLTAVMGGCEIDLRQAAIDGEAVHRRVRDLGRHRDPGAGGLDRRRPRHAAARRLRGQDAAAARRGRAIGSSSAASRSWAASR